THHARRRNRRCPFWPYPALGALRRNPHYAVFCPPALVLFRPASRESALFQGDMRSPDHRDAYSPRVLEHGSRPSHTPFADSSLLAEELLAHSPDPPYGLWSTA